MEQDKWTLKKALFFIGVLCMIFGLFLYDPPREAFEHIGERDRLAFLNHLPEQGEAVLYPGYSTEKLTMTLPLKEMIREDSSWDFNDYRNGDPGTPYYFLEIELTSGKTVRIDNYEGARFFMQGTTGYLFFTSPALAQAAEAA